MNSVFNLDDGTPISHYSVVSKLGSGGMGEVYLAEDNRLKRNVALKFLPDHLSKDPEFKARFEHEAQAVAALDHPNIISIHELGEHNGRLYIAMQYLDGRTLQEMLDTEEIPLKEALKIVEQICSGLAKAHEEGVIHRDIKPANILVTNDGVVKILDFGLAKSRRSTTQTKTGTTVGTLQYESPEQCRGETVDRRSDIFSVGVLLYQLITGHLPFTGDYDAAVVYAISHETPEPLARYKSGATDELQRIVDKAIAKDPEHRYQHADGTAADLKRLSLPAVSTSKSRIGLWASLSALVIALITVGILVQQGREKSESTAEITEHSSWPTVAVLYLETFSEDADQEFFAAGMTEDIITDLTKIHGLRVLSRHDVMPFRGKNVTIEQIGNELEVDYVVEGSVRRSGDQLRITAQLIKVADGFHAWADRYDRTLKDVFAVQEEIAASIAHSLEIVLTTEERAQLAYEPTENIDAYDLYVQAKQKTYDRTPQSNLQAEKLFRRAIALDENYLLAKIGLADCFLQRLDWNFDRDPVWWTEAKQILDDVRSRDSSHAELFIALTNLHRVAGDDQSGSAAARRAVQLRPNASQTHYMLALTLRGAERKKEFLTAAELDPRAADPLRWLARDAQFAGQPEEALRFAERAVELAPDAPHMLTSIGRRYMYLGKFEEARELFTKLERTMPESSYGSLAYMSVLEGQPAANIPGLLRGAREYQDADNFRRLYQAYSAEGDHASADEALQNAVRIWRGYLRSDAADLQGNSIRYPMWLLWADCVSGTPVDEDSLQAVCNRSLDDRWDRGEFYWLQADNLVRVYTACGKNEEALELLEEILGSQVFSSRYYATDPDFADLSDDPCFTALLKNHGWPP